MMEDALACKCAIYVGGSGEGVGWTVLLVRNERLV